MTRLRATAVTALTALTVLTVALLAAACGDRGGDVATKVSLRYHPQAGAVHRYALDQVNTMSLGSGPLAAMGEQKLTLQMHFTQHVTGPVPGGIEVKVTFDSTNMEAPGMSPDMMARELQQLRGLVGTVLFDERAQVVSMTMGAAPGVAPELASQLATGVKAMAFALPEQPVGRGDSWTVLTDLPVGQLPGASGAHASRTTLTVKEIHVGAGADTTLVLGVETTFPGDPIGLTIAGQPATLRLSGSLAGEQVFSLTRGVVVSGTVKGTMKMNVSGGPVQQGMTLSSATETSVRLR